MLSLLCNTVVCYTTFSATVTFFISPDVAWLYYVHTPLSQGFSITHWIYLNHKCTVDYTVWDVSSADKFNFPITLKIINSNIFNLKKG